MIMELRGVERDVQRFEITVDEVDGEIWFYVCVYYWVYVGFRLSVSNDILLASQSLEEVIDYVRPLREELEQAEAKQKAAMADAQECFFSQEVKADDQI